MGRKSECLAAEKDNIPASAFPFKFKIALGFQNIIR
jgi:hypothetical protein